MSGCAQPDGTPSPSDAPGFFDDEALIYDAAYDEPSVGGYALRDRMDSVLRLAGEGPGKVLDAGMGPGRLLAEMSRRGWTVAGVDGSKEMVALARTRVPGGSDGLAVARIESLPFPDASFDLVVATGVVEYVDDPRDALLELARVLRPGGRAIVSNPSPIAIYALWRRLVLYPALRLAKRLGLVGRAPLWRPVPPRRRRFESLLREVGLAVESVTFANYLALPTPLDAWRPGATMALAERLKSRGGGTASALFATQMLFCATRQDAGGATGRARKN
jgi:SAM-dependent methyltransferase